MISRRFLFSFPIFLIVYLLQEGFVTQMRLPAGGFSLILIFTLAWASMSTPEIGALTGFGAGLAMDLSQSSSGPMGQWTLVMIIACYSVAFLGYGDDNIRANPINIVLLTTIGTVAARIVYLVLGILLGEEAGNLQSIFWSLAGTAFWTAIISPLLLKVISFIHANVFGLSSRI